MAKHKDHGEPTKAMLKGMKDLHDHLWANGLKLRSISKMKSGWRIYVVDLEEHKTMKPLYPLTTI